MTKMLVVIDPKEERQTALERCREISADADLQLHVCMFIAVDNAQELGKRLGKKSAGWRARCDPMSILAMMFRSK